MLELEKVKNKYPNVIKIVVGAVAVVLLLASLGLGHNSASTKLNGEKVKYKDVARKITLAKTELKTYGDKVADIQLKIKDVNSEYLQRKTEFDDAKKLSEQKDSLNSNISKLNADIESKKKDSTQLDADIQSKKAQVASLDQVIKVKQEAPVQLPAGQFLVGKDIKAGRYKVVAVGRGSNFNVYDKNGSNVVNTIIYSDTSDGFGVSEYVTVLSEGYMIDAQSAFKYIPVE